MSNITSLAAGIGNYDLAALNRHKAWLEKQIVLMRTSITDLENSILDSRDALRQIDNRIRLLKK